MPPAPGTRLNPPLNKFAVVPTTLTDSTSPLQAVIAAAGLVPNDTLAITLRALQQERSRALERPDVKKANKKVLNERVVNERRVADEAEKKKEAERLEKKEAQEKAARELLEKNQLEERKREKEEQEKKRREAQAFEEAQRRQQEVDRIADEKAKEEALRRAKEAKEEKEKAVKVLSIVAKNEAARATPPQVSSAAGDAVMSDAPAVLLDPPIAVPSSVPTTAPRTNGVTSLDPPILTTVSDGEDEDRQPRPLFRHKSSTDKKKRKREQVVDSDASDSDGGDEPLLQKVRKLEEKSRAGSVGPGSSRDVSVAPVIVIKPAPYLPKDPDQGLTPLERKLKEEKFIKHSIPTGKQPAPGTATAFYLPKQTLVPPKPESKPNPATPKRQSEVSEDYSKAKPGTQTAHHTFHTWAEAYLRPYGEDDLAFLAPKPEDISPYLNPPLGKHYLDQWEEEDADGGPVASTSYASPLEPPVLPRFRPEALTEDALGMENVFLGPLSERLLAAVDFEEGGEGGELEETYDREEELAPLRSQVIDAVDLEERIKKELRFIGILGEEDVDWSAREDDEVSSTLRACQQLLHRQTALNEGRKAVLSSVVKDRMAYQEYEATLNAQERVIESGWTKRQRTGKKKSKKEREKAPEGPKPPVSVALLTAIDKREKLVTAFKPFFEEDEDKARYFGIPEKSVYEGITLDDDGQQLLLTE